MTIARNIELRADNWSSKIVWSWYISNWLSADQTNWCTWTTSKLTYTSLTRTRASKTWIWLDIWANTSCDTKRQLTLSNNEKIWDLAWNVWEHVNKWNTPTDWVNYNSSIIRLSNACWWNNWYNFSWSDYSYTQCAYINWYTYANIWPSTPLMNSTNWVWRLFSYNLTNPIFVRWGLSNHAACTGLFALALTWSSTAQDSSLWFRCAK